MSELIYTRRPLQLERELDETERYVTVDGDVIVASFLSQEDEDLHPQISEEERDGNARLFLAAPAMLEALVAQETVDLHFRNCQICGADLRGNVWFCQKRFEMAARANTLRCEALRPLSD
jgi:hypothetical protein